MQLGPFNRDSVEGHFYLKLSDCICTCVCVCAACGIGRANNTILLLELFKWTNKYAKLLLWHCKQLLQRDCTVLMINEKTGHTEWVIVTCFGIKWVLLLPNGYEGFNLP